MRDVWTDKAKGCLIGGAVGDALGYAVEFVDDTFIFQKFGERGITEYSLVDGAALISDDTQMTLFTAQALLTAREAGTADMAGCLDHIYHSYRQWVTMQFEEYPLTGFADPSPLAQIPALYEDRAPGRTCILALAHDLRSSIAHPTNNSKGCGGVMRISPIPLFFGQEIAADDVDLLAAEASALTHGHELGYIPSAILAHILRKVVYEPGTTLLAAVQDAMTAAGRLFANAEYLDDMLSLLHKAIDLSAAELNDLEAIRAIGEGWVAEETLAIAVYCALKYEHDFESAIIASVNHSGDSDSTGAVTGNLLGAHLGLKAIPQKFLEHLELRDLLLQMAEQLPPA